MYVPLTHSTKAHTQSLTVADAALLATSSTSTSPPTHQQASAAGDPPPPHTHTHRLWESAWLKPLLCSNLALHSAAYRAVQGKMYAIVLVTYKYSFLPPPPSTSDPTSVHAGHSDVVDLGHRPLTPSDGTSAQTVRLSLWFGACAHGS